MLTGAGQANYQYYPAGSATTRKQETEFLHADHAG
jgi:hypothetical protein